MPIQVKASPDGVSLGFSVQDLIDISEDEQRQIEQGNALEEMEQVFITKADEKVRPSHAALHGTVWDADDPNAPVPPLGFGCRCKLEFRAKSKSVSSRTGLPPPKKNAPEPGNEALAGFWKEAKQSPESNDPGGKVTPVDTFGQVTGKEIEDKTIKPEEAFDIETGDVRASSEVKNIADAKTEGRAVRSVLSGIALLETFAVSPSQRIKIIAQARELKKIKSSISDSQLLFEVTLKLRPSLVGTPSDAQTRKNARRVARAILRSNGPL